MFYSTKAYLNASGTGQILILTHDVKRALMDSKVSSGLVNVLSSLATTSVALLENDPSLQKGYFEFLKGLIPESKENSPSRRSGSGADRFHFLAAFSGTQLTVPFAGGRLSVSPFQDIVALDFEPKSGRREFVITIVGDGAGQQK